MQPPPDTLEAHGRQTSVLDRTPGHPSGHLELEGCESPAGSLRGGRAGEPQRERGHAGLLSTQPLPGRGPRAASSCPAPALRLLHRQPSRASVPTWEQHAPRARCRLSSHSHSERGCPPPCRQRPGWHFIFGIAMPGAELERGLLSGCCSRLKMLAPLPSSLLPFLSRLPRFQPGSPTDQTVQPGSLETPVPGAAALISARVSGKRFFLNLGSAVPAARPCGRLNLGSGLPNGSGVISSPLRTEWVPMTPLPPGSGPAGGSGLRGVGGS